MTARATQLEPNWLGTEMREAASDLALAFSPGSVADELRGPLSADDASRLRAKMVRRYLEWTGHDLLNALVEDRG